MCYKFVMNAGRFGIAPFTMCSYGLAHGLVWSPLRNDLGRKGRGLGERGGEQRGVSDLYHLVAGMGILASAG